MCSCMDLELRIWESVYNWISVWGGIEIFYGVHFKGAEKLVETYFGVLSDFKDLVALIRSDMSTLSE